MIEPLEQRRLLSVGGPRVVGFALINTDTDRAVRGYARVRDGAVIVPAAIGVERFSIRAIVKGAAKTVAFEVNGELPVTDAHRPFHVSGGDRDVPQWDISAGTYAVTARPYRMRRGEAMAGVARTIHVTVDVEDAPRPADPLPAGPVLVVDAAGPFRTVADAVREARPGDTVLISPGVYRESLTLDRSGRPDTPITLAARSVGTVTIDAGGAAYTLGGPAKHVAVRGINFTGARNDLATGAVRVGTGWSLTDVTVGHNDGAGVIVYGRGATLLRVTAEHNGQQGIAGSGAEDVVVKDSVIRFNNAGMQNPVWKDGEHAVRIDGRWFVDPLWEAGAGKWMNCRGVTLDGLTVHDNGGPGIWLDYNNSDVAVRNSTVHDSRPVLHDYDAPGINIELTTGGVLVENNTLHDNPGGNVVVESSRNVTVRGNHFGGGYVALNDWFRGEAYTVRGVQFTGNMFEAAFVQTGGPGWTSRSAREKSIAFDGNTYAGVSGPIFVWGEETYSTLRAVRDALDFEDHGAVV